MTLAAQFSLSEHIDEAFERCGFAPSGLTPGHIVSARRSVRTMLASWNNDSVDFWKVNSGLTHTQTLGETNFALAPGTIDVLRMAVLRNNYTTPMVILSASDWFNIPDKAVVQGMATRTWIERIESGLISHIYPFAENSTDVLVYDAMVQFNDSSILKNTPDIMPLWDAAFTTGLTAYLAEKFAPARFQEKWALYGGPGYHSPPGKSKSAYEIARQGNRERADTVMIVGKSRRWRR